MSIFDGLAIGNKERILSAIDRFFTGEAHSPDIEEYEALRFVCDTTRTALQDAQPEEVTEAELIKKFDPAPVFSESFHWICGWIKDNYPNGLRITHDKGE